MGGQNPVSNFLRSLLGRGDQGDQSNQPKPVVDSLPTPPLPSQPQPLPFVPSAGQAILESVLAEIDRLSSIERAIIAARLLNSDEPLGQVSPEDWARLIEERVGKAYAEALRKWLTIKGCGEQK